MLEKTVGFIGAGRITKIILRGLKRAGAFPAKVVISDQQSTALQTLKQEFPKIDVCLGDNILSSRQEVVFLALHPPNIMSALKEIKFNLGRDAILISLAPKFKIADLVRGLGGFRRIVRMIPNASSIVNKGYNPVFFSPSLCKEERESIMTFLCTLGECPEVSEETLEAYVVLTAIGPTYLWFQFDELRKIGSRMGLADSAAVEALSRMVVGATETMFVSGMPPEVVMDLVRIKPMEEVEENLRNIYRTKLLELYHKLSD